jgi:glycosidase
MFRVRHGEAQSFDPLRDKAQWIDAAVIYGVVPALFGKSGLAGVTAHLDRLAALGVNTLWLSPVTASPPRDFGYAVTDYFRLRADFGDEGDLRELIRAAHARGLRVIMDFVPNHLSDQHPYFADTEKQGRASPYFDFFARTAAGEPAHYFDWRNLKNLNYDNAEVQRLVIEAFAYWLREYDVDGFRVDVAWGPRERAGDFWPRWRAELNRIKPDLLLLAEASARDPYYLAHGFNAAYDWTDKLGQWSWHEAFEDGAQTVPRLRAAIAAAPQASVFRFLDNNDTGARFVTRHGEARTRVAAAMLLTLPGLPGLYAGQEVGAAYEPYKGAQPLAWDDPHGLQSWYARLIALRQAHPALRTGGLRLVDIGPADRVLAYERTGPDEGERILVLLNYSAESARLALSDPALQGAGLRDAVDLLSGGETALNPAGTHIVLPGEGVRILKVR